MRRYLGLLVRLAVSSSLIYWVISNTEVGKILGVLRSVHWAWLLASAPLILVVVGITAFRWQLLLKAQGIELGFLAATKWTYVGAFFNSVFPGLTGGDFLKAYYVSKETTLRAAAATSVFVDRIVGLAAHRVVSLET